MSSDFTLEGYRGLLEALLSRGYRLCGFHSADPSECHLILRHDIDMALEPAVAMAEVERDMGAHATYFVLLRSELYNPFTPDALNSLGLLAQMGHEIGLHLDAGLYGSDHRALDAAAARECGILEAMTGRAVRSISFHRPAAHLLGEDRPLAGRLHAYQARFFNEMGYCTDSRGEWRHGHPLAHPAVQDGRALQLLTHPIWWADPQCAPHQKLQAFLDRRVKALDSALTDNCAVHMPGATLR